MSKQPARICILGGGFGGLYTALRLDSLPWEQGEKPEIVLVDRSDRFVFTPLLYELLTGELQAWEVAPNFSEILKNTNIRFCQGVVSGIDLEQQQVQLQDSPAIPYDKLVLALGGESPLDMVPGASAYAFPFRSLADAYRLEERLRVLEASDKDKIRVAIVGAGYCGVELACKLADRLGDRGRFRLVEQANQILRTSPEFNRETALKVLEAKGIWIDLETAVDSIEPDSISLLYKGQIDTIAAELVIWTAGMQGSNLVKVLPLKQNQRSQLITTPTLQAIDRPEIFVLGDLADCRDVDGQQVPASAQAAFQQSDFVAWNIWAALSDRPLLSFRYQNTGEMLILGTQDASISSMGVQLNGQLAYTLRRLIYLYRMPNLNHQLRVGVNWISSPILELLTN
ncbi:NAD(P)/FAD-dependent oxidoreductase [Phormidium sp. LEGE 05292]|uniref:NAD(P)/FAD-dependent oxidoreductase n=1 Tax=[Phormidium] sp. LEGE 05292 TaxID=767427 RepID=UPI0018820018|nr:NAD(P)/FAD-dependent oxidoreductase [Phormidium sp. LEGE 05292]MBE9225541.1 NAD(P)/FAD-dependent oxidoreductase [Phormidium sp. LEGE 05292]